MDSLAQVIEKYRDKTRHRFAPLCQKQGITYPPARVTLLALKEEKQLEVWAGNKKGPLRKLHTYPILAASGTSGPKRCEGDCQVPEGFYLIDILNPSSRFHLSMRVNYPNAEDIAHKTVSREKMGSDIYIHGNKVSIGCLAMGDDAIEEIFTLVALVPEPNRHILIAPRDLRTKPASLPSDPWIRDLYKRLTHEMQKRFS